MRFSLACYTIRLRLKGSDNYLTLSSFRGGQDLLSAFDDYLTGLKSSYSVDQDRQRILRVTRIERRNRSISGVVETGQYGYEAELHDVNTQSVSHIRTPDEAEMMPFFFLASIPSSRDEGVLILQRRANYGIRTVFLNDFAQHLKGLFPELLVEFNPLVTQGLLDRYLNGGSLKQLRFIRFPVSPDIADNVAGGGHDEQTEQIELRISARRNHALPYWNRLRDGIQRGRPSNELIEVREITDFGFEYDTIKAEVETDGNRRTVDLADLLKLRAYYDITSEVEVDPSGHPRFESISDIASGLLGDALEELGRDGTRAHG